MKKNDIVRCKCIDLTIEGQGVCKSDGLVIFVKNMLPEEEADIKIVSLKKNLAYGIIDKMITPSSHRIESDCPISYKCGGCDFRHIDYDYQLFLKKNLLVNTLRGFNVLDIMGDDNPNNYRNKVQVPVKDNKIGFYRKHTNDVIEFTDCHIESKLANEIVKDIKSFLYKYDLCDCFRHLLIKHAGGTDEVMIGLIVPDFNIPHIDEIRDYLVDKYPMIKSIILNHNERNDNVILGDEEKVIFGDNYITDVFDGIKVKLSLKSFYQINQRQMIKLYNKVKEFGQITEDMEVLDLYSGVGSISLFVAKDARKVTGVEIVKEAVDNAIENARINNINNCDFILADASKGMDEYIKGKDLVIVDPPRKGLKGDLVDDLISSDIKKIVYVSCNPATLARDLKLFEEHFIISDIQPVDMFPHTLHCECVVGMQRKEDKQI